MDIYELIEVLKRQPRLLAIGLFFVMAMVVAVWLSVPPKYTATLRLVVVPEGVTRLTDADLGSSGYFRIATIYADLLSSAEARDEIIEGNDIQIDDLRVTRLSESSSLEVAVDASTASDAVVGALGSFSWLEERIRQSSEVVFTPTEAESEPPEVVDAAGRLGVDITLEVEPVFEDVDPSTWFEVDTFESEPYATPLALLESGLMFEAVVDSDASLEVSLGPEIGTPFDVARLPLPPLPEEPRPGIDLVLRIRRGAIVVATDGDSDIVPGLNRAALSLSWNNPAAASVEETSVAVLLLNPDVAAVPVGQRRAPIFAAAVLMLGSASLVILATARDGLQRRRNGRRDELDAGVDVFSSGRSSA